MSLLVISCGGYHISVPIIHDSLRTILDKNDLAVAFRNFLQNLQQDLRHILHV